MNKPEMKPVVSKMVAAIGYDAATGRLYVEFNGGKLYVYSEVPPSHFTDMQAQGVSVGKFINEHIKPHYLVERLEG